MKNIILCMILVIVLSCPVLAGLSENRDYVEGEVLVEVEAFEESIAQAFAEDLAREFDLEIISIICNMGGGGTTIIALRSDSKSTAELIKEISSVSYVKSIQANYIDYIDPIPNPPEKPAEEGSSGCNTNYSSILLLFEGYVLLAIRRK